MTTLVCTQQDTDEGSSHRDDAVEEAKKRGLKIVVSNINHLQLDMDGGAVYNSAVMCALKDRGIVDRYHRILITTSQNGGQHVYIRLLKPLKIVERIALQAALGSDPVREVLSLNRVLTASTDYPLALFETETAYPRVLAWLGRETGVGGPDDGGVDVAF